MAIQILLQMVESKIISNMKNLITVLLMIFSFLCYSCVNESEDEDWNEQKTIEVASEIVPVKVFGVPDTVDGIKVKNLNSTEWESYPIGFIDGFAFEEGYEYMLKVEVIHLANPPMDGSNIRCRLLDQVSKVKIEPDK